MSTYREIEGLIPALSSRLPIETFHNPYQLQNYRSRTDRDGLFRSLTDINLQDLYSIY